MWEIEVTWSNTALTTLFRLDTHLSLSYAIADSGHTASDIEQMVWKPYAHRRLEPIPGSPERTTS